MEKSNKDLEKCQTKKYPTIGVCGLDCGFCPKYYTDGPSRCPGCGASDFSDKHPSCSFITCCVKKRNHEVCAECPDFPCPKFKSEEEYQQLKESSSYPPYKNVIPNLRFIKEHGIDKFIKQQKERIKLLETMIEYFDDGRSKSLFCRIAASQDLISLRNSINKALLRINAEHIEASDRKNRGRIFKTILNEVTVEESVQPDRI